MDPEHYKYMPHAPESEQELPEAIETDSPVAEPLSQLSESNPTLSEPELPDAGSELRVVESESPSGSDSHSPLHSPLLTMLSSGLCQFFYDIFNPLLIPAYCTLLLFELSILAVTAPGSGMAYTLTVLGATCVFPVLGIGLMRMVGLIDSISLQDRKQRFYPYILSLIGMVAITLFFAYKGAPLWMLDIYIGAAAVVLINFILNFFIKVSNHCSALAAALAMFFAIQNAGFPHVSFEWWCIGTILLAGIIGSISIFFGRHNLKEVFVGYATGFLPVILFSLMK